MLCRKWAFEGKYLAFAQMDRAIFCSPTAKINAFVFHTYPKVKRVVLRGIWVFWIIPLSNQCISYVYMWIVTWTWTFLTVHQCQWNQQERNQHRNRGNQWKVRFNVSKTQQRRGTHLSRNSQVTQHRTAYFCETLSAATYAPSSYFHFLMPNPRNQKPAESPWTIHELLQKGGTGCINRFYGPN